MRMTACGAPLGGQTIPYTKSGAQKLILVLLQPHAEGLHPISRELAGAARRLAAGSGFKTAGIFIGGELISAAKAQVQDCGLEEVYLYLDERFRPFIPELHTGALLHCVRALRPGILLVGATPEGRCLAPLAAVPLETGVTADCTELALDAGGLLVQTRPAFGGGLMARIITPDARPQIATVRYGIFRGGEAAGTARLIQAETGPLPLPRIQAEALTAPSPGGKEADYVLALGGGLRTREDIGLFKKMAHTIGAELMCSRSLVERGWFPQSLQIGLSGRCIAPRLLITMGVSGSVQFMAGVQAARKLCALNTDPGAPILRAADIPLICDIYQTAALF
ncbi:MAG: electron transfer flavoprotein subunit alpha/FixB family protein [Treponema sp.]|jgi:electron transfer flavoprotein alpha subunit|nr:electron transfer flavoprotein subunit alpha/FixB family protein [Treponema sp.]